MRGRVRIAAVGGVVLALLAATYFLPVVPALLRLVEWLRSAGVVGIGAFAIVYVLATDLPGDFRTS